MQRRRATTPAMGKKGGMGATREFKEGMMWDQLMYAHGSKIGSGGGGGDRAKKSQEGEKGGMGDGWGRSRAWGRVLKERRGSGELAKRWGWDGWG